MWQSIAKTKAFSMALLLLLSCGHFLGTGAQNEASESTVAVKFDEYGQINDYKCGLEINRYPIRTRSQKTSREIFDF